LRPAEPAAAPDAPAPGRALIVVTPVRAADPDFALWGRPYAPFLAQLIATRAHAAQTRPKRRAGAAEAAARYRAGPVGPRSAPKFDLAQ
jgi:hypothetical protein